MLILVSDLCFVSTVFVGDVAYTLMSSIVKGHLVRSLGSVFITFFLHVEDSSFIIVVYRVGILVESWFVRILWRGRGVVDQYCCLVVDWRAVDVVGRRRHSMVYQVGGGWERVREMVGEMVGEMVVLVVVATVERGV